MTTDLPSKNQFRNVSDFKCLNSNPSTDTLIQLRRNWPASTCTRERKLYARSHTTTNKCLFVSSKVNRHSVFRNGRRTIDLERNLSARWASIHTFLIRIRLTPSRCPVALGQASITLRAWHRRRNPLSTNNGNLQRN